MEERACEDDDTVTPRRLAERSDALFDEIDDTEVFRERTVRNVLRVGDAAYEKEVRSECTERPSLTGSRERWYRDRDWKPGDVDGLAGPVRRCSRHSLPSSRTSTLSGVVAGSRRALRFLILRTADCSRLSNASTSPRSSESRDLIASAISLLETRMWSSEDGKCVERGGERGIGGGDWGGGGTIRSGGRSGLRLNRRGMNLRFVALSGVVGEGAGRDTLAVARRNRPETDSDSLRPCWPSLGLARAGERGIGVSWDVRAGKMEGRTGASSWSE